MQVNSTILNIYRYYEKNPEAMSKYIESVKPLAKGFADKIVGESVVLESNLEKVSISPAIEMLSKKIGSLFSCPAFSKSFSENGKNLFGQIEVAQDLKSQLKVVSEFKSRIRKALRRDPQANSIAIELIDDCRNPLNQGLFEPLNKLFKSFTSGNSETMTNFRLDTAMLAPKEIRTDYYNAIKYTDETLNRPANELYADLISSLVKK